MNYYNKIKEQIINNETTKLKLMTKEKIKSKKIY